MERKFALFQMLATGVGGGGGHMSKDRLRPQHHHQAGGESFHRVGLGEITCRNSTVISNSHLQLVISVLTGIILVVIDTVNLQFCGALVPISWKSVLRTVAAQVLDSLVIM